MTAFGAQQKLAVVKISGKTDLAIAYFYEKPLLGSKFASCYGWL
jgi:hypothetical protein